MTHNANIQSQTTTKKKIRHGRLESITSLSGPVLRDTRETISAIPPYCALWGFWCLNMANWVRYPLPLFWAFPPWRACEVEVDTPLKRGISAILARYPMKTRQMGAIPPLYDTNLERVLRDRGGGISHWAAKLHLHPDRPNKKTQSQNPSTETTKKQQT